MHRRLARPAALVAAFAMLAMLAALAPPVRAALRSDVQVDVALGVPVVAVTVEKLRQHGSDGVDVAWAVGLGAPAPDGRPSTLALIAGVVRRPALPALPAAVARGPPETASIRI